MEAFATTLPIFDRLAKVYGYDLRFRSGFGTQFTSVVAEQADVDFWKAMGFDDILGMGRAHVFFPRDLLLKGAPFLFPPDRMIVGLPEDVTGDGELIDSCKGLKEVGYELAMDNFGADQMASPFLEFGDIVWVDIAEATDEQQEAVCEELPRRGIRPLAKNVSTPESFDKAMEAGYWYFQGDFFRQPVLRPGRELPTAKAHYLQLLQEVNKPELPYDELEGLIKQDVAMTYRLLRFINSVWYGLKQTVNSIRHALVLLGPVEVRLWASMLVLRELGEEKPRELFRRCLIRAKMAEGLAPLVGMDSQASELFLMGMFSLVDALTDLPLSKALEGLPLSPSIKMALLDRSGELGTIYEAIEHYELGRWESFSRAAATLELAEDTVPAVLSAARKWADDAMNAM